jgi:hypothetical protein
MKPTPKTALLPCLPRSTSTYFYIITEDPSRTQVELETEEKLANSSLAQYPCLALPCLAHQGKDIVFRFIREYTVA